jgi:dTDP-4-dehydrorhamnose 3,5-epimerase
MFSLQMEDLVLPKAKLLKFKRFKDERGFFTEHYRESDVQNLGDGFSRFKVVQTNESSSEKNVIRGLHFQWDPYMGKLVRPLEGTLYDILLDIRKGSPTFGKAIIKKLTRDLESEFDTWIWAPPGIAHGFFCTEKIVIEYLCTGEYSQNGEANINPLASDIDWSLTEVSVYNKFNKFTSDKFLISEKDKSGPNIAEWEKDKRSDNFIFSKL